MLLTSAGGLFGVVRKPAVLWGGLRTVELRLERGDLELEGAEGCFDSGGVGVQVAFDLADREKTAARRGKGGVEELGVGSDEGRNARVQGATGECCDGGTVGLALAAGHLLSNRPVVR